MLKMLGGYKSIVISKNYSFIYFSVFESDEARKLRVSVNGFLDLLTLVLDTIGQYSN